MTWLLQKNMAPTPYCLGVWGWVSVVRRHDLTGHGDKHTTRMSRSAMINHPWGVGAWLMMHGSVLGPQEEPPHRPCRFSTRTERFTCPSSASATPPSPLHSQCGFTPRGSCRTPAIPCSLSKDRGAHTRARPNTRRFVLGGPCATRRRDPPPHSQMLLISGRICAPTHHT